MNDNTPDLQEHIRIKRVILLAFPLTVLLWCVFVSFAAFVNGPGTTITYIVPDNYEGFLAVIYDCPGAAPANRINDRVVIQFSSNGIACIADTYTDIYTTSIYSIRDTKTVSGKAIPFETTVSMQNNRYALVDLQVITSRYGPQPTEDDTHVLSTLWLGEVSQLANLMISGAYTEEEHLFFEARNVEAIIRPAKTE